MPNYFIGCTFFALLFSLQLQAQKFPEHPELDASNSGKALLVHLSYLGQMPGGDLADRFGITNGLGGGLEWISANNLIVGLEGHYFFGRNVKEDPLAILRTPEGNIIGNNQLIADVVLRERGFYIGGLIGKLFPIGEQRSGIRITLGAGALQHKIRLQDNTTSVAQITGDYAKGYDRLTGGFTLNQFIGWQHLGGNRRSNWFIGLNFSQGFTKSLRSWDFTEMRKLEGQRSDLQFGIKLGWTLPFYLDNADKIDY